MFISCCCLIFLLISFSKSYAQGCNFNQDFIVDINPQSFIYQGDSGEGWGFRKVLKFKIEKIPAKLYVTATGAILRLYKDTENCDRVNTDSGYMGIENTFTLSSTGAYYISLYENPEVGKVNVTAIGNNGTVEPCYHLIFLENETLYFDFKRQEGGITVISPPNCFWIPQSSDSWISITSNLYNSGYGLIKYSVQENMLSQMRNGNISVRNKIIYIEQYGKLIPEQFPTYLPYIPLLLNDTKK